MIGRRHVVLNVVLGNKTYATSPTLRRIVEHIVDVETIRVGGSKGIKLLFEKDVLEINIGIDEGELRLVIRVLQCSVDDLQHGRNTSTTGDHADLARQNWGIFEGTLRTTDANLIPNFEKREVAGDVALFI